MMKNTASDAARDFWSWFQQNQLAFQFISDMDEAQRNALGRQLDERLIPFCPHLHTQIGLSMCENPQPRLIITTACKMEYFHKAEELLSYAPDMPGWEILALIPPLPKNIKIRLNGGGAIISPDDIWFLPMDSPGIPGFFGVAAYVKYFEEIENPEGLKDAIVHLIALILGERSFALDIQHVQVGQAPSFPLEEGMACLYDLPDVLAEYREEFPSPHVLKN